MVAIWFAALFGLGSLVLPSALPEHVITLTGADALIPAMGPPLGIKARVLIALAATVVGGIAGLALARRIVAAQRSSRQSAVAVEPRLRSADRHPDAPVRRPISALEELGEDRLPEFRPEFHPELHDALAEELGDGWEGGLSETSGRRRGLATLAQPMVDGPPDEPGERWIEPAGDEIEPVEQDPPEEVAEEAFAAEDMPLEGGEWGDPADSAADPDAEWIEAEQGLDEQPEIAGPPAASSVPEIAETALEADESGEDAAAWADPNPAIREAQLAELGVTDLVERLAYAIQIRQEHSVAVGESILAKKAPARQRPAAPDREPPSDGAGDGSYAENPMPAALRPLEFDEQDDDYGIETDLALSDLGLREHSSPEHWEPVGFGDLPAYQAEDFANESEADEDDDSASVEESYSSLLNLKMGAGRPAQSEDPEGLEASGDAEPPAQESAPPAGTASAEPDAADKALREALARLQRISGAA